MNRTFPDSNSVGNTTTPTSLHAPPSSSRRPGGVAPLPLASPTTQEEGNEECLSVGGSLAAVSGQEPSASGARKNLEPVWDSNLPNSGASSKASSKAGSRQDLLSGSNSSLDNRDEGFDSPNASSGHDAVATTGGKVEGTNGKVEGAKIKEVTGNSEGEESSSSDDDSEGHANSKGATTNSESAPSRRLVEDASGGSGGAQASQSEMAWWADAMAECDNITDDLDEVVNKIEQGGGGRGALGNGKGSSGKKASKKKSPDSRGMYIIGVYSVCASFHAYFCCCCGRLCKSEDQVQLGHLRNNFLSYNLVVQSSWKHWKHSDW